MAVKTLQTVENALAVLEVVAELQPIGVSALARHMKMDKNTAFAIELLFQAAKGLIDRFPAFESDFNHERKTLSESGAEGKSGFLPLFLVGLGKAGGFLWKKEKEESD